MRIVRWWPSEKYPNRLYPQIEYPKGTHVCVRLEQWYYLKTERKACVVDWTRRNGAWSSSLTCNLKPSMEQVRHLIESEGMSMDVVEASK